MVDKDNLFICREHVMPVMYRGEECPWCVFIGEVEAKLASEYRRGFGDGVRAIHNKMQEEQAMAAAAGQAAAVAKEGK